MYRLHTFLYLLMQFAKAKEHGGLAVPSGQLESANLPWARAHAYAPWCSYIALFCLSYGCQIMQQVLRDSRYYQLKNYNLVFF